MNVNQSEPDIAMIPDAERMEFALFTITRLSDHSFLLRDHFTGLEIEITKADKDRRGFVLVTEADIVESTQNPKHWIVRH